MPLVFTILGFWVLYKLLGLLRGNANASRLPPGPLGFPIIGNMHQLGKPPHRSLHDLAKQYGPIMLLRLGSTPTVWPESAAAKYVAYNEKNLCLAPYGDYWRLMRKVCVLELLSAKRVESFRSVREEEVYLGVKSIWEKSKHGKVAVNVRKSIASLISSIIWRTLAGTKISQDDDLVGDELNRMVQQVTSMIGAFNIGDFIPSIAWIDELSGVKGKMKKAHNFFDRVVGKIIDEHIEERRRRGNQGQRDHTKDLVDILLEMAQNESDLKITREHIKATVFDMFLGALETTITTLEWAMSEMVRNPHVAQKLQAEIESIAGKQLMVRESDLVGMEYLQCVVKEVFRRRGCPGAGFAMANIELVLAQLVDCFDWTLEGNGNPSELDMTETFITSLLRKDNLLAVPTFKLELNM
ncbi:hypothetical protein SUGI_0338920 [Cryptomeria japonica]|nr:hypothetical protein SUGI_0338920 [Cryptomeria japonica]